MAGSSATSTCTNAFGTPVLVVPDTPGVIPQSLTVTGDDLELFYEEQRSDGAHLVVRQRSDRNAAFGDETELDPSLWSWCPAPGDPNIDVSDNGLRLYMTCVDTTAIDADGGYPAGPIRVAERATRSGSFALNPNEFGTANVSLSVSRDELTAFWSDYSTTTNPLPVMATRQSLTDPFGPAMALTNVVDSLHNPELADDDEHLFGSLQILYQYYHIYMFTRRGNGWYFDTPTPQDEVVPHSDAVEDDPNTSVLEGASDYTPTVSGDCNSLYFMRRTVLDDGTATDEIFVAKR
jgi:hypothetical protein